MSNAFADALPATGQVPYLAPRQGSALPTVPWSAQPSERMISKKQFGFAETLLSERDLADEERPKYAARTRLLADDPTGLGKLTSAQASALIAYLLDRPKKLVHAIQVTAEVPAGRYAVENGEGELRFYKVDRPAPEGRWAGYVFVKVMASDEEHSVRGAAAAAVLSKIAAVGADAASKRYGQEIGKCGVCSRTLTDAASRAAGIGPRCAEKYGW